MQAPLVQFQSISEMLLILTILSFAAAYFSLITAVAVLLRDWRSAVHRLFAAGMFLFGVEQLFLGFRHDALLPRDVLFWEAWSIAFSALIPAVWLGFSVTYARANYKVFLARWKWVLLAVGIVPIAFTAIFRESLFSGSPSLEDAAGWLIPLGWSGKTLQVFFVLTSVLILFNLERTVRSSTGRIRWQIKFMALGAGLLFAARFYLASESLLFSGVDTGFLTISAVALIAANLMFAISLYRGSSLSVDVYISTATIQNSLTITLAGLYLVTVGALVKLARYFGFSSSLHLDALVVLLSVTALAVLMLSNRLRRDLRVAVSRHFSRPTYDYRDVWMELTQRTTSLVDVHELSAAVSRMISESLEILSVSVWLVDESKRRLWLAGSTALSGVPAREIEKAGKSAPDLIHFLQSHPGCVDLNVRDFGWSREISQAAGGYLGKFKIRYIVGLQAGGDLVGMVTLNDDRVGGQKNLSQEDIVLLETLAAQLAASLLNLRLSEQLRDAKEIETFQTVSTFFVHDLKNLASRLSLTMQNLPLNFESPEFRADALRVISASVTKIDDMCERLAMLRKNVELKMDQCDLSRLVAETLAEFKGNLKAKLKQDLQPMPKALMDPEQIHKVLTNLVLNANDAVNGDGVIQVATIHEGNTVVFAVRDNGCGMSEEFIERSLFRPFQTTKKKGLGIGLFHSRLIVEAHKGTVEVNSTEGIGTEFRVILPIA